MNVKQISICFFGTVFDTQGILQLHSKKQKMKSLKNIALVFAAALITFGVNAQTAATPATQTTQTTAPATKEKTKTKEKPNGATKTVTKTKPTAKTTTTSGTTK